MRHGRFIKTALVVVAAMAVGPAAAMATPGSFTDDTVAEFGNGSPGPNVSVADPGLSLTRSIINQPFGSGPGLPSGLTATPWAAGGTATVAGGVLSVQGAHVNESPDRLYAPGQVMEFGATFSGDLNQHVGFADTLDAGQPLAIFSSGDDGGLYARSFSTATGLVSTPLAPPGHLVESHTYRIEWSASDVKYYVDNGLVATHAVAIPSAAAMRPVISDFTTDGGVLMVSSLGLMRYPSTGTFDSSVRDAGAGKVTWGALTAVATPSTGVSFQTRTGQTANAGDATWSSYQPVGPGGAIQSPGGRYIQYRATLSTTDDRITPSLDKVEINYDVDTSVSAALASVTTPPASGNSLGADKTAPKVSVVAKSLRASKKGTVSFRVGCPATEKSCTVKLSLKNGKKIVASKLVTIKGGKTKTVTLTLNSAAKKLLAKRHSLKLSSVVSATDAAGNRKTATKQLMLRRAAG